MGTMTPATIRVPLHRLPGHRLPGCQSAIDGDGVRISSGQWEVWTDCDIGRTWQPISVAEDGTVEVQAPEPEMVTVTLPLDVAERFDQRTRENPRQDADVEGDVVNAVRAALAEREAGR